MPTRSIVPGIPGISPLPTVLIESSSYINGDTTNEDVNTSEGSQPSPSGSTAIFGVKPSHSHWVRRCWDGLGGVYAYWNHLLYVPIDLYLGSLFANTRVDPIKHMPNHQLLDHDRHQPTVGLLGLHPRKPLLAVCIFGLSEILFYNTDTSEMLWTFKVKLPKPAEGAAASDSRLTCMRFSNLNKLAVGLTDGTVRVIKQDLRTMMKSSPGPETEQKKPTFQTVKLLPLASSRLSAKIVGRVTNLLFSPNVAAEAGDDIWLAISTEQSGVWIWNQRTNRAIRAVSTAGINEGCLHWITLADEVLEETQEPMAAPPAEKHLSGSTMQKWGSVFGNFDDLSKLDKFFAPSLATSVSSGNAHVSTPISRSSNSTSSSMSSVGGLGKPLVTRRHFGESLLIFGTKDGKVNVHRLWNSSRIIKLETSVNFLPSAFAKPPSFGLTAMYGPASGEITHLAIHPHAISTHEVSIPISLAFQGDHSSIMHQFTISVPSKLTQEPFLPQTIDFVTIMLNTFVNLLLIRTNYRRLSHRLPRPTLSGPPAVLYHSAHTVQPPRSVSPSNSTTKPKSFLTSITTLPNTHFLLATLRPDTSQSFGRPKGSQCVLFSQNPSTHLLTPLTTIHPLTPIPRRLSSPKLHQPLPSGGYYTTKLAKAGIHTASPSSPVAEEPIKRPSMRAALFGEHDFRCGPVAWAPGKHAGGDVGAFLYQPASLLDPGVGVGMFEVVGGCGKGGGRSFSLA